MPWRPSRCPATPHFLTAEQEGEVRSWLLRKPTEFGFRNDLWMAARVARLTRDRLGVAFHPNYLREWLSKRGDSPQKPVRRPKQRNPVVIDAWLGQAYPAVQQSRRREGPPRADRRDRLVPQPVGAAELVAHRWSAGTATPGRRCRSSEPSRRPRRPSGWGSNFATDVGGYFSAEKVVTFLRDLLRHLRGKVVVVWDGGPNHQGPVIREFLTWNKRLRLERLPAYAPDLNTVEAVWSWLK